MSENICTQLKVGIPSLRLLQWVLESYHVQQMVFVNIWNGETLFPQELLAEVIHKDDSKTASQKLWRLMVHALAWSICIGSTTASVLSIYHFSEYMHQVRRDEASARVCC